MERKGFAVPTTALEWQLYSTVPGADKAAEALAKAVVEVGLPLIDRMSEEGCPAGEGVLAAYKALFVAEGNVFDAHAAWGACDTEPRNELQNLLVRYAETLGVELDAWELFGW